MKPHSETVQSKSRSYLPPARAGRSPRPGGDAASESKPSSLDPSKRHALIAEAAYYRAERRGFAAGNELEDWLEAEAEISRLLGQ